MAPMATIGKLYPPARSFIPIGGKAVYVFYGQMVGGIITNPALAADQGIAIPPEPLWLDMVNVAATHETATCFPLWPGGSFTVPANFSGNLSVNAATSGHMFSAVLIQPPPPAATPIPSTFPPAGPTTVQDIIPSYLYVQYNDDANLQALVDAYNNIARQYLTLFNTINLPVYTGPLITGPLLDWVAEGLYGMTRPALASGFNNNAGPLDTYGLNDPPALDDIFLSTLQNVTATSDDIFKRIMTWNFYKGDGNVVNIRWLKRRIIRFLNGINGVDVDTSVTYGISVTFSGQTCNINLGSNANAQVLKEAIDSQAVQLPFQLSYSVTA
jgi:hypothetical protein